MTDTPEMPKHTLVTGVIGSDTHIVGNRILSMALEDAGYNVVALGALTPSEDFVKAAIETAADAIMVSSLYGQGELDCQGFRDMCVDCGESVHRIHASIVIFRICMLLDKNRGCRKLVRVRTSACVD